MTGQQVGIFERREGTLSSGRVQFWSAGEGHPILYLHAAGGVRLGPALQRLAESFRIYALVLPGFDGTQPHEAARSMEGLAGLAAEFIEKVVGQPCDALGHSFGGWVAAWLAVLAPQGVPQLVLEAPEGFAPEGAPGLEGDPESLRRLLYAHPERLPPEEKPAAVQAQNHHMVSRYHGTMVRDEALVARLGEIQCPTLILQGTRDGLVPPSSGRLLKREISVSYLYYVFDAAHAISADQPERFVRVVREFLLRGEAFIIHWKTPAS